MAIRGVIGSKSEADFPVLSITSLMQPTKDSIMYLTPCSFSSELKPARKQRVTKGSERVLQCKHVKSAP